MYKQSLYSEIPTVIVEITLKNRSWTYTIYSYSAIATKVITNHWNHQIDIIVEFTLQNSTECIYILWNSQNLQNRLVQAPNRHNSWIHIEKRYRIHIHIVNSHNYQIRLVQFTNWHHSWIHIEKWVPDIYNTSNNY
jgi:hypothetical protein